MIVFYASMAFLESSVVVYLRALYYPSGFAFPLVPMDAGLVWTEVLREFATMIMLLAPAALVTRSAMERFAWFCFGFGVWDVFYYFWLKVLLDWPSSMATFDLLFLIPVPWVGPVWAPCLLSAGLILLAMLILRGESPSSVSSLGSVNWTLLILGASVIIFSFVLDPLRSGFGPTMLVDPLGNEHLSSYIPNEFPWHLFLMGCSVSLLGLLRAFRKTYAGR